MSWLDPLRVALDARPEPVVAFFRDDDAGRDDPRLAALLDRFESHGAAVDVAVIPALVRLPLTRLLRDRVAGGGVRLHQHGLAHVDHEPAGRKYEFGPARDRAHQAADLAEGRRRLLDCFGEGAVEPVFTPPWNRCTTDTGLALLDLGLPILSRDDTAVPLSLPGLVEVPVTVDWFGHRRGVRWTPAELAHRLADRVRGGRPVGVMLHHAVTDAEELARVDEVVALLSGHSAVRLTSIADVAGLPVRRGATT